MKESSEFINIFDSYISSGDEPNYAFVSAYKEYKNICTNNYIVSSLEKASNYIDVYNDFLNAILKFKNEMNIEIIDKFYDSINIAYTSLGDINYILKSTIAVISNKIILTKEIENIYHEKKYELKVMLAIPILMFGILNLTAKDFISPMYQSLTGYMIITLCLALLIGAYFIGEYIMRIDIE